MEAVNILRKEIQSLFPCQRIRQDKLKHSLCVYGIGIEESVLSSKLEKVLKRLHLKITTKIISGKFLQTIIHFDLEIQK